MKILIIILGIFFMIPTVYSQTRTQLILASTAIDICESALRNVGERVRVKGKFDGFAYDTNSKHMTVDSDKICSDRGAGVAYAELRNHDEKKKVWTTEPGTLVIFEGNISKIEDGRFVTLDDVVILK